MLAVNADTSSEDGGGNLDPGDPISGAELEGYIRDGGSSDQEELEEGAELHEYARSLGLDPHMDQDLLWVAKEAFAAPLPTGWTDHVDSEGRLYFCNLVTQESSWFHPTDLVFKQVIELVKALRSEHPPPTEARRSAALHDHLVLAHRDAQAGLEGWSGPYDSEQGPYYYNRVLDLSTWENPVEEREWELAARQRLLRRCLLSEWPCPPGEGDAAAHPCRTAAGAPLGLTAPPPHGGKPRSPSSARSLRTFYSARSIRSGRSATPSRALSRSSTLPSQSPPVSPSCAEALDSFTPPQRSELSNLRSLLKPVAPPSGPEADLERLLPLSTEPRSSERSPVRSSRRSLAQQHVGSPRRHRIPPRAASPSPGSLPAHASAEPALLLQMPQPTASCSSGLEAGQAEEETLLNGTPSPLAAEAKEGAIAVEGAVACQCPRDPASKPGNGNAGRTAPDEDPQEFNLVSAISEFMEDASRNSLELPLGLSADQRKRVKALVGQHSGLKCESYGFGAERCMHIFRETIASKDRHEPPSGAVDGGDHVENVEFTFGPADNLEIPRVGV